VDLCVSILEFCAKHEKENEDDDNDDDDVMDDLNGLYLVPLCDGSIGSFSRVSSRPFILLNETQSPLLTPWIASQCVDSKALKPFLKLFDSDAKRRKVGLCKFSPVVVARELGHVLPRSWRNKMYVVCMCVFVCVIFFLTHPLP
jgi:hypothetical protein